MEIGISYQSSNTLYIKEDFKYYIYLRRRLNMASNNFAAEVAEAESRLASKEQMLAKGLDQPFTDSTSGVRKLMYSIHKEQALMLLKPEVPFVQTGYENRYADRSSSIIRTDSDYVVEAKISKFSTDPQREYILILRDIHTNKLKMQKRISYVHTTETYGYLYNNSVMDTLEVGCEVQANRNTVSKSKVEAGVKKTSKKKEPEKKPSTSTSGVKVVHAKSYTGSDNTRSVRRAKVISGSKKRPRKTTSKE